MKKLFLLTFTAAALLTSTALASEKVILPDYECVINDSSVYYFDSEYPLISYRNITYFPMTYGYCRALSLSQSFVPGDGLYIAYTPFIPEELPIYETTQNQKYDEAVIPEYNIYINGEKIDNRNSDYPFLNFRGVTYFPLTYSNATEELNLDINFVPGCLTLKSMLYHNSGRISVSETNSDNAVLEYYIYATEDNDGQKFYKMLDSKSGAMTDVSDYSPSEASSERKHVEITIDEEKGEVFADGVLLPEVKNFTAFNKDDFATSSVNVYANITTVNGVDFMKVSERFEGWREDGSSSGSQGQYCYVLDNDKPVFVGNELQIENAAVLNSDIYFAARPYVKTIFSHALSNSTLYKLSGGVLTDVTADFANHNSATLLGEANGKLYLKCEWCPNPTLIENSYHNISPANDGYFTYDGTNLEKIANYIYTDEDIFFPDGTVYAVTNRNMAVTKIH